MSFFCLYPSSIGSDGQAHVPVWNSVGYDCTNTGAGIVGAVDAASYAAALSGQSGAAAALQSQLDAVQLQAANLQLQLDAKTRAYDELLAQSGSPLNLSIADGALVGGAILSVWCLAWGLRAMRSVLADGDSVA